MTGGLCSKKLAGRKKNHYAMSRRRRTGIFAVCLLAAAFLIWLERSPIGHKLRNLPKTEPTSAGDLQKYHTGRFTVVNVVDGDTIDVDIPDGQYEHTRIRLWGIDTPETKDPRREPMYYGAEATEFATSLTLGKQVTLYLDQGNNTRGKYGRLLAYVQLPNGRYLNEVLLKEGFAYADLRFKHSFYNKYKQLEASARSGRKGLWAEVRREQLPEWLQRIRPELLQ